MTEYVSVPITIEQRDALLRYTKAVLKLMAERFPYEGVPTHIDELFRKFKDAAAAPTPPSPQPVAAASEGESESQEVILNGRHVVLSGLALEVMQTMQNANYVDTAAAFERGYNGGRRWGAEKIDALTNAIAEARRRLARGRSLWNGPCHACDAVLEQALKATPPTPPVPHEVVEALRAAEQFIANGIEFGFIRMPDRADPANDTLPKIRAALASMETTGNAAAPAKHG